MFRRDSGSFFLFLFSMLWSYSLSAAEVDIKVSERTGLPIVHLYHGSILNHKFEVIEPTEENVKRLMELYLNGLAERAGSQTISKLNEVNDRAAEANVFAEGSTEALINSQLARWVLTRSGDPPDANALSTLRGIEVWAGITREFNALMEFEPSDAGLNLLRSLDIEPSIDALPSRDSEALPSSDSDDTEYMRECRRQGVPVPPNWGDPAWTKVGVLDPKYTFSAGADGPTEVWAFEDGQIPGVCLALPRIEQATQEVLLLGIICQGEETGKACFWDNIDIKTGTRLEGPAVEGMRISMIQDGNLLGENCTNCHRGFNAFPIHPNTTLDLRGKYAITPDKRYEPISDQSTWGNPKPLLDGQQPCATCHELPELADSNGTSQDLPSAYCGTVLAKAANLTMPRNESPAQWCKPSAAYAIHIDFLRKQCGMDTSEYCPD